MINNSINQDRFEEKFFEIQKDGDFLKSCSFVEDKKTGFIYNNDKISTVGKKCVRLAIFTPLITLARVVSSIARTIFHFLKGLTQACTLNKKCIKSFKNSGKAFTDIFRSVIYGCAMEGAAIYGIAANPYKGRVLYGSMERALNRHGDIPHFSKKFYLARCFQPIAKRTDENYLQRIHKVRDKLIFMGKMEREGKISKIDYTKIFFTLIKPSELLKKHGYQFNPDEYTYKLDNS